MKLPILAASAALAAAVFSPSIARAVDACYIDMGGRQLNLTGICQGGRDPGSTIYDSTIHHVLRGEANLMVYDVECPWTWSDNRWVEQEALAGRIGNVGTAAAHNVTLRLRGEVVDENGDVVQSEVREVLLTEVPSQMVANFEIEFSFIPNRHIVENIEWN